MPDDARVKFATQSRALSDLRGTSLRETAGKVSRAYFLHRVFFSSAVERDVMLSDYVNFEMQT